jgi:Tol biopolymer transport system component/tRNA A-37 threonylcarbamoyl transferase component Bud32
MVGSKLGPYRIESQLGAGGMGVVYRAIDERIDREVAIKAVASDEVARRRMKQEAKLLSRLNHPNVATLYEYVTADTADGDTYLVMELVGGESLRERLRGGALPLPEVYSLAAQIASGLAAAHEAGVIHRDLKPENIVITHSGTAKILDFGLSALASSAVPTTSTTASIQLWEQDSVSGTLPYMAPEQLRGEAPDVRSDIYSAGIVFYELATGQHPFAAQTGALMVDAILNRDVPPVSSAAPNTPVWFDRVVARATAKDPATRYPTARELELDMRQVASTKTHVMDVPAPPAAPARFALVAGAAALLILLAIGIVLWRAKPSSAPPVQFTQVTNFSDGALAPAISPDGRMLAYLRSDAATLGTSAQRSAQVYVQMLPNGQPKPITHDGRAKNWPMFSLDGSRIAYTSTDQKFVWDTWEVPVLGGESTPMLRNASGLTWIDDQHIVYSKVIEELHMGIATGTESRTGERMIYVPPGMSSMAHRSFPSPDKRSLLVVEMDTAGTWLPCRLLPYDGSSSGRPVGPANAQCTAAAWSPDGKWMYFTSSASGAFHLWRQEFPDGVPEQLTFGPTEEEGVTVAPDGKSIYTAAGTRFSTVWIHTPQGDKQLTSQGYALLPAFSPDEKSVYYLVRGPSPRSYISAELWRVGADGTHAEQVLPGVRMSSFDLSPDGTKLLYTTPEEEPQPGIWIAALDRRSAPRQLTREGEFRARFGPNGQIIYMSNAQPRHLMRMEQDGSNPQQISPAPVVYLIDVDGVHGWATMTTPAGHGEATNEIRAIQLVTGKQVLICDICVAGAGPGRVQAPPATFSPDGRWLYFGLRYAGEGSSSTAAVPLRDGVPVNMVRDGHMREQDAARYLGAKLLPEREVFPGKDPSRYLYTRSTALTNIYRITLP